MKSTLVRPLMIPAWRAPARAFPTPFYSRHFWNLDTTKVRPDPLFLVLSSIKRCDVTLDGQED